MKKMILGILALLISSQLVAAPWVDPAIRSNLLSNQDALMTVIAQFKSQSPFNREHAGMRPSEIIKQKQLIASVSQRSLREMVTELKKRNSAVISFESLWINNSMVITAKNSFIQSLIMRDDLERLELNTEIKLFDPIQGNAEKGLNSEDFTYGLQRLQASKVWNELGIDGTGVTVGVLDTGIDSNHESLVGRTIATKDFVSSYEDNAANDGHGHGTHCAGTIGGTNAGGKHIGVAPGVQFVVGKIFGDSGSTTIAAIMSGMQWMTDPDNNPETEDFPRVVSNSWGGPLRETWQEIINTWRSMGIIPVFAAGNSGPQPNTIGSPGGYQEVISIGATDSSDKIAYFSSRGPVTYKGETYIKPDVSAPGVDVYSAKPGGGFQNMSGTSMATPHVAGVVALMLQADPEITVTRVKEILEETALELGDPGKDGAYGSGRVNAFDAVQFVLTGGNVNLSVDAGGQDIKVEVSPGEKSYMTGPDGEITISLPAGEYQLKLSAFGYVSKLVNVEIIAKQTVSLAVEMELAETYSVTFDTRDAEGVPRNSKIAFPDVPIDGGNTNGSTFVAAMPGGSYTAEIFSVGFERITISFDVNSDTHLHVLLKNLPEFLVVDHGKKDLSNEIYYTAVLDRFGKRYNVVRKIDAEEINGYETVIWFTGGNAGKKKIATPEEQAMLTAYLANGGRLIITGQDVAYALKGTEFLNQVVGVKYLKDKSDVKIITNGSLTFELDGGDSANNQRWPDVVAVHESAEDLEVLYNYQEKGPAVIANSYGEGKLVYMAFGFEGINGEENRWNVMDGLLQQVEATISEKLKRIARVYKSNTHAYHALINNFELTRENRSEVENFLKEQTNKEAFRPILRSLIQN